MCDGKKRDKRHIKLLKGLRDGMTLEEASRSIGVSSFTVRRWRAADPELAEAVAEAMAVQDDAVEAVALKNCLDPDGSHNVLRMFWLKCRRPETYRDQMQHTHGGVVNLIWTDDENREDKGE
jgi:hypothetical protein